MSAWQRFKSKEISYLTIPLLVMATFAEFIILAIGFNYQRAVCVPPGMGVTFFGIGPIGATILAVELLKLPLAIWTASRRGWVKALMVCVVLPLICVLTFQLVKDMAVYEMGVALSKSDAKLELAAIEDGRIAKLDDEIANRRKDEDSLATFVAAKRADRDRRLAELSAKQEKARAEIDESLKRNDASRTDAITLTDYQTKELSEVESKQARIIAQADADTAQITKALAELRSRREGELSRATYWNAEEARIENAYKAKLSDYTNRKNEYDKAKAEYDKATFLERQVMRKPVDPGVPPEREVNRILKPTLVAELEAQIKAKEAELIAVSNRRRDGVAQVESDARKLREEFDRRSAGKREEADRKREQLLAARAELMKTGEAESKAIDAEFQSAVAKEGSLQGDRRPLDIIRAEREEARKKAEVYYQEREDEIRVTQVHRIATTVEIVRGLIFNQHPTFEATAKERGDTLRRQIDMVRIWVYPVLAFIVAFLPTLMVEIGFTTLFREEKQRPPFRTGFLGYGLHRLYTRAGRRKILAAERLAAAAAAELAGRDRALAAKDAELAGRDRALAAKDAELVAARASLAAADGRHAEELRRKEEASEARLAAMSEALNRAVLEKDELRDRQSDEVERRIRERQNAWLERVNELRRELDEQREAAEAERTALLREQQEKLVAVTEDCKSQILEVRRRAADAELGSVEKSAGLSHELKEARNARQAAEARLAQQTQIFETNLARAKDDAAHEIEKAAREEAHRAERLRLDFTNAQREAEAGFAHRLLRREQELVAGFEARIAEERKRLEQDARRRESEVEQRAEARARDTEARWTERLRQSEEAAETRARQSEEQSQSQLALLAADSRTQAEAEARRLEAEFKLRTEALEREAETRRREALQQQEAAFLVKLKEQAQAVNAAGEARTQTETELRRQEAEFRLRFEAQAREAEARQREALQQQETAFLAKLKEQAQAANAAAEVRTQAEAELRRQEAGFRLRAEAQAREAEARRLEALQQQETVFHAKLKEQAQLALAAAEKQSQAETELRRQEAEFKLRAESAAREAEARRREALQQQELAFLARLKQQEQEIAARNEARDADTHALRAAELAALEEEWNRRAEARVKAVESRLEHELRQKEESSNLRLRQREQQLQAQTEARLAEAQGRHVADIRAREEEWGRQTETRIKALESRLEHEARQKDEASNQKLRRREQELQTQADAAVAEIRTQAEEESRRRDQEIFRIRQREQELTARLAAQAEARQAVERKCESEIQAVRAEAEERVARAGQERDEALKAVAESEQRVGSLEDKLKEVSRLFSGWQGGPSK